MKDLSSPRAMWLKAVLFLVIGLASSLLIFMHTPTWSVALLLPLTIWAFCRSYYFGFYVLEKYVDPSCRYSGLLSLARHILRRRM